MLTNTFHALEMSAADNRQPGMYTQEISHLVQSSMLKGNATEARKSKNDLFLNPKTAYPLSKVGTFGSLYRSCTISEKGLEEQ